MIKSKFTIQILFLLCCSVTAEAQFSLNMAELEPSKIIEPPIANAIEGQYICPLYTQYMRYGMVGICAYPDGMIKNCDAAMAKGIGKGGFYVWDVKNKRELYRKDGYKGIPQIYATMNSDKFVVVSKNELSVYNLKHIEIEEEEAKVEAVKKEFEEILIGEFETNVHQVSIPYKKVGEIVISHDADYVAVTDKKTNALSIIETVSRSVVKEFEPGDFVINGQQREINAEVMLYDDTDNLIIALKELKEGGEASDANIICIKPRTFEINAVKTTTNKSHDSPKALGTSFSGKLAAYYPGEEIISIFEYSNAGDYNNVKESNFIALSEKEEGPKEPFKKVTKDGKGNIDIQFGRKKNSDPSKLFKPKFMVIDGNLLLVAFGSLKGIGIWDLSEYKKIGVVGNPYSVLDSYRAIGLNRSNQVYAISKAPDLIEIFNYKDIQKAVNTQR